MEKEVNHGLSSDVVNSLKDSGYESMILKYYTNDGQDPITKRWHNYLTEIHGMARLVKNHMGGNYGAVAEYEVINSDGQFRFIYVGDQSAEIRSFN